MPANEDERQAEKDSLALKVWIARESLRAARKAAVTREPAMQAAVEVIARALVAQEKTVTQSILRRDPLTGHIGPDFGIRGDVVHGNVADGLFAIAGAIHHLAKAIEER